MGLLDFREGLFFSIRGFASWPTWSAPSTFSNINNGPISGAQTIRFMATSGGPGVVAGKPGDQPLFTTTPSIRDKSIYDWSKTNLASVNRDHDRVLTTSFQLNQRFFDTGRQTLDAQVAFLREDAKRVRPVPWRSPNVRAADSHRPKTKAIYD